MSVRAGVLVARDGICVEQNVQHKYTITLHCCSPHLAGILYNRIYKHERTYIGDGTQPPPRVCVCVVKGINFGIAFPSVSDAFDICELFEF